jgi:predicted transcriptional regulator
VSSGKIAPSLLRATQKGTEMTEQNGAAVGADNDLIDLSTEIVSAYVSHNALSVSDLPKLIADVHTALRGLQTNRVPEPTEELKPAVPVRKSIAPDYIICLEDGKKFKSLKRHLRTHYDMSPEEYREKWGLPADYPMVAPNYSATRSRLAKDNGLGRKAGK